MARWHQLTLACVLAAACALAAQASSAQERRPAGKPNIIFILADDLGYGDIGPLGQKQIRTPHLDRMAAEGMRFTQAYSGATVCAPSRCALMTGYHTGHTIVRGNRSPEIPLRPEDVTPAEVLKSAGYATAIIGKWGVGPAGTTGAPNKKGFDYFFGYHTQRDAHNYYPEFVWRNTEQVPLGNVVSGGVASKKSQYVPDLCLREALSFIDKHKDRPFFLYFPTTIPHANNEAGKEGMEIPSDAPYSDKPWPQPQKNHAAMITRLDSDVGALMQRLKEHGLDRNTVIFFSSDNGPHREGGGDPDFFDANGPLRGIKRDLYEGGIRVPTLAWGPGRIKAGAVSDHPWAFWDFLPTAAELAGKEAPKGIDGISIVPELLGRRQRKHDFLYWEFHERGFSQAVRMGDWKYVHTGRMGQNRTELFNLKTDLGETTDVSASHPEVMAKIHAYLKTARTPSEYWPVPAGN